MELASLARQLVCNVNDLPEDKTDIVYVGRPLAVHPVPNIVTENIDWGNPFRMNDQNDELERRRVIDCYKMYLLSRTDLIKQARIQLCGRRLACWCAPQSCHAHVLAAFANSFSEKVFMTKILSGGIEAREAIEQYIFLGIDLNLVIAPDTENKDITGTTAVGIAAKNGDLDTLNILVSKKEIDLNKGRGTSTPLILASAYGHVEMVRMLVGHVASGRVNINAVRRDGISSLAIACSRNNAPVVRLLLRNNKGNFSKIKVNQRSLFPERVTPLLLAIRTGSLECVQLLLGHPGLSLDDNIFQRQTPLEIAQNMQRTDIVDLLKSETTHVNVKHDLVQKGAKVVVAALGENNDTFDIDSSSSTSKTTFRFPSKLSMNKMCRIEQPLPISVVDWIHQHFSTEVKSIKSQGKGWHEIYVLTLKTTKAMKRAKRLVLRIYRNQLSYWKFNECHISAKLEVQAAEICHIAGVPTPTVISTGTCTRAVRVRDNRRLGETQDASWSLSEFVEEFRSGRRNSFSNRLKNTVSVLRALWKVDLRATALDYSAIPVFNNYFEHLDYVDEVARRYNGGGVSKDAVAAVKILFHRANIPIMRSTLVHFDLHGGNVSLKAVRRTTTTTKQPTTCEGIKSVIDWEFAGILDPRLDLVKVVMDFVNEKLRKMNRKKSSGASSASSANSGDSDSSSDSSSDSNDSSEEDNDSPKNEMITQMWNRLGGQIYNVKPDRLGAWFPWLALSHVINVVFGRAVSRLCVQGKMNKVPRCDLRERAEDTRMSARWCVKHKIIDVEQHPDVYSWIF